MQKIEQQGYKKQEIIDILHYKKGSREIKFRYDLLNKYEQKIGILDNVTNGEVSMNSLADIKRTAKFTIQDNGNINWLSDRIQPFCMLKMNDTKWIEWSMGIFLLSSPTKKDIAKKIWRDVECYDGLQVLTDDKTDGLYYIPNGLNYITVIKNLLIECGITKMNLESTDKLLINSKEWESNTSKLKIVNELLQEINYTSLWVDEWGYYTASKYRSPIDKAVDYIYKDDLFSIIYGEMQEELDLFHVPNKFTVVVSNVESEPLTSTYANTNVDSPLSVVNRGRIISDIRTLDSIADQIALNEYTQRIAFNSSQVYGNIEFQTAIMPFHSYSDVLQLEYNPLAINDKYSETGWTIPLVAGASMKHNVRKVMVI